MFVRKIRFACLLLLLLSPQPKLFADPVPVQPNDGLITFTGTVLMPDGSAAVGATVEAITQNAYPRNIVRADESGLVQIYDRFGNGAKLHASSPDGVFQATLVVKAADVRTTFAVPINLELKPAAHHVASVFSAGQPVEGAQVVAQGSSFRAMGVTGKNGNSRLRFPAGESIRELVAWHPHLGVAGWRDLDEAPHQKPTQLSLIAPVPHTIRLVDTQGKPVADVTVAAHFNTEESGWILSGAIKAAHAQTDEKGEAVLPWAPGQKIKYVDVELINSVWKKDKTDRDQFAAGITTVHIRRETPITGRIVMPKGVSAEGILVTGFGFGPNSNGDIPYARARQDGTFTMQVPSYHGYILGILDSEWASDCWTGMILGADPEKPAEIEIEAYRGTPLAVRVTRGSNREPVAKAWIYVKNRGEVDFIDESGKERSGGAGIGGWARSDADGVACFHVGLGKVEVRLSSGDWNEEQSIEVDSDEPIEIAFHRVWQGQRQIAATLNLYGETYKPSETFVAHAWSERDGFYSTVHETEIGDQGTVNIAFDAETLSLLVIDREKNLSGFTKIGPEDSRAELILVPTATYSGTVVNEQGEPLTDRTVQLLTPSRVDAVEPQQTDEAGKFKFAGVPVDARLRLEVRNEPGQPRESMQGGHTRSFVMGENRQGDAVRMRLRDNPIKAKPPVVALSERLADRCRNTSANRMRTLAVLKGDDSPDVSNVTSRLLNTSEVPAMLRYLSLVLPPEQLAAESQTLAELDWPLPAAGEIVLIVLGHEEETIATERINTENVTDSVSIGIKFLKQNRLPTRNALDVVAKAKKEAASSGRRLWVIEGGPRCGPCFRLARWIDEHHTALEKDYVILKLMSGVDQHVDEVIEQLDKQGGGVPWHAILEPDGTVMTTSTGPVGNIGMPGSVEGIRHFRQMLETTAQQLSSEDIDQLVGSLAKKKDK